MVLLGPAYWSGLVDWMRAVQLPAHTIAESDLELFHVTDDPAEAIAMIQAFTSEDDIGDADDGPIENELR